MKTKIPTAKMVDATYSYKLKIPEGWRRVRQGALTKKGDKFDFADGKFQNAAIIGKRVMFARFIRKIKPKHINQA